MSDYNERIERLDFNSYDKKFNDVAISLINDAPSWANYIHILNMEHSVIWSSCYVASGYCLPLDDLKAIADRRFLMQKEAEDKILNEDPAIKYILKIIERHTWNSSPQELAELIVSSKDLSITVKRGVE